MPAFEARRKLDSKDRALVAAVKGLLSSPVPYVRLRVAQAISAMQLPKAEAALIPLLSDPDTGVKAAIIKGFAGTKNKKVLSKESFPIWDSQTFIFSPAQAKAPSFSSESLQPVSIDLLEAAADVLRRPQPKRQRRT